MSQMLRLAFPLSAWGVCVPPQAGYLFQLLGNNRYVAALLSLSAEGSLFLWERVSDVSCNWLRNVQTS